MSSEPLGGLPDDLLEEFMSPHRVLATALLTILSSSALALEPLRYNHPGLVGDLGVGLWAWPLPMDFDGDGDLDLAVCCPDKPSNGVELFENVGGDTAKNKFPVFKPGKRISKGLPNGQVSYMDGQPRVLSPGHEYPNFLQTGLEEPRQLPLPANVHPNKVRGHFWRQVDFDGDGIPDFLGGAEDGRFYFLKNPRSK